MALPAILTAAGTLGAGLMGFLGGERQRSTSIGLANSQYQRAVKDLKAAGLNPMLAVGAQAGVPNIGNPESEGVSSAMAARQMAEQLELMEMQSRATEQAGIASQSQAAKSYTEQNRINSLLAYEQELMDAQIAEVKARTSNAKSQDDLTKVESQLRRLMLPAAENEARYHRSIMGKAAPFVSPILGGASRLAPSFLRFFLDSRPEVSTTVSNRDRGWSSSTTTRRR